MWAGNAIASRLAVGEVSPMALVTLRWVVVVVIVGFAVRRTFVAEWPSLRPRWRSVALMGALGYTAFNALFYAAAHHTTAVNITILQGAIPIVVLVGALLAFGTRIRPLQAVGAAVTLLGVATVAARGDPRTLAGLSFNIGDLWMIAASIFYAGYTLGLRARPPVSGLVFFAAMAGAAVVTSLPLLAYEAATGTLQWPTPKGWAVLAYVSLGPSLLSQIFFMRGVELIGPGRAGLFANLVPIFGAFGAATLLGEAFAPYHAVALCLVLGGIWLAERRKALPNANGPA
jgi:drug/metabolite transporter (DMT)-like permease